MLLLLADQIKCDVRPLTGKSFGSACGHWLIHGAASAALDFLGFACRMQRINTVSQLATLTGRLTGIGPTPGYMDVPPGRVLSKRRVGA